MPALLVPISGTPGERLFGPRSFLPMYGHVEAIMKCEELLGGLNDYLDGETRSALCQALQQHLADCDACRIVVDNLCGTITLYRVGQEVELPVGFHQRLCNALRQRWLIQSRINRRLR
jgi:hypothetical protein